MIEKLNNLIVRSPVLHIPCPDWMDKPLLYFFRLVVSAVIILLAAIVLVILLATYYLVGIGLYFYFLSKAVKIVFRYKGGVTLGGFDKMNRLRLFREMMKTARGR